MVDIMIDFILVVAVLGVIFGTCGVSICLDQLGIAHSEFVAVCAVAVLAFVIFKLMKRYYENS